ncbi:MULTISPECIES: hypothetical protein [Sphingobacterium]|uniref:hypothetical protein n=1 Tax=Sphingobacterium TaxID=28453 RepID=UPI0030A631A9
MLKDLKHKGFNILKSENSVDDVIQRFVPTNVLWAFMSEFKDVENRNPLIETANGRTFNEGSFLKMNAYVALFVIILNCVTR